MVGSFLFTMSKYKSRLRQDNQIKHCRDGACLNVKMTDAAGTRQQLAEPTIKTLSDNCNHNNSSPLDHTQNRQIYT